MDLRAALGVWVKAQQERPDRPFGHLVCVEIRGSGNEIEDALDNVFAALQVIEAKGTRIQTVALPLLGTGSQMLNPKQVAAALVSRARSYLERSASTKRLVFVEINESRAQLISEAMDAHLGRERVTLPNEDLVSALRQDVQHRVQHVLGFFEPECESRRDEWLQMLQQQEIRSVEFGVHARKLVELYVERLGVVKGSLAQQIREVEKAGRVAPWVCAYMHVLRQLGNEAAHENMVGAGRVPAILAPGDLTVGLFCVQRLLEAWTEVFSQAGQPQ